MEDGNTGASLGSLALMGIPTNWFQTRIARGKAMTEEEVKKLGPLGLRLVAGLRAKVFDLLPRWSVFGKRSRGDAENLQRQLEASKSTRSS